MEVKMAMYSENSCSFTWTNNWVDPSPCKMKKVFSTGWQPLGCSRAPSNAWIKNCPRGASLEAVADHQFEDEVEELADTKLSDTKLTGYKTCWNKTCCSTHLGIFTSIDKELWLGPTRNFHKHHKGIFTCTIQGIFTYTNKEFLPSKLYLPIVETSLGSPGFDLQLQLATECQLHSCTWHTPSWRSWSVSARCVRIVSAQKLRLSPDVTLNNRGRLQPYFQPKCPPNCFNLSYN